MRTIFVSLAAVMLCGAAFAADPSAAPSPATPSSPQVEGDSNSAQNANDKNAIVCRQMPPPIGSRLGARRVCRPEIEWENLSREGQDVTRGLQQKSTMGRPPGG